MDTKSQEWYSKMGKKGGAVKSAKKRRSCIRNGKLGGRPKGVKRDRYFE